MMARNEEEQLTLRFISSAINSLRRTVERPFEAQVRQSSAGADVYRRLLQDLEGVRLSFVPNYRIGSDAPPLSPSLLGAVVGDLDRIKQNREYAKILRGTHFRMFPPEPQSRRSIQQVQFPAFYGPVINLLEAIEELQRVISQLVEPSASPGAEAQRELFKLRSVVPPQKIAPAQFDIRNNRVVVAKALSVSSEEDRKSIESARTDLVMKGEQIIKELQQSNCDKRLLDHVQFLQSQLKDETDAIKIGLTNLGCEMMCVGFEQELPTAIVSMLKAHGRGVNLFVGQFPEWNRFIENASQAHLDSSDVDALKTASEELVGELNKRPELVDPEVPKTILRLSEMLKSPSAGAKRAAFAVLRSVENLISVIYTYGADFVQKTASKTIDEASTAASKLLVRALLAIALTGATAIGPMAGKIPEMGWLKTATDIVQKQLEKMNAK